MRGEVVTGMPFTDCICPRMESAAICGRCG